MALEDRTLIDMACSQDPQEARQGFEAIYRKHAGMVLGLALRMVGRRRDAEEITQDVFVSLHRGLKDFRGDSTLRTWLYRVTVNRTRNSLRSVHTRQARELPMAEGMDAADPRQAQAEAAAAEDAQDKVGRYLQILPEDQRTCLLLRAREGLSYEQIAEAMGVKVNTVRTWLKRARDKVVGLRNGEAEWTAQMPEK